MRLDAIACCVRLTGSGARAEKCRTAECVRLDRIIVVIAISKVVWVEGEESCFSGAMGRCVGCLSRRGVFMWKFYSALKLYSSGVEVDDRDLSL